MVWRTCYQQQRDGGTIAKLNWGLLARADFPQAIPRALDGFCMVLLPGCRAYNSRMNVRARCQGPPSISPQEDYAKNRNRWVKPHKTAS